MNSLAQQTAERAARRSAHRHYENFPVASWLLPRRLRTPVALLYAFARRADDIADEGDAAPTERLQQLEEMESALDRARTGLACNDPGIGALAVVMNAYQLPWQALYDLLSAFRQDVEVTRYADFAALADYCRRSANPVGALLLHLYGAATPGNLERSDAICTALQLLNFLQDLDADLQQRGRIYLPQDEMTRFGVCESDLRQRRTTPAVQQLLALQLERAASLLAEGAPLTRALPGRAGLELRAIVAGGRRIRDKLHARPNPYQRPRLHAGDWLAVFWSALRP